MSGVTTLKLAPKVSYEPCTHFDADDDGICAGCGWMSEDHELPVAA